MQGSLKNWLPAPSWKALTASFFIAFGSLQAPAAVAQPSLPTLGDGLEMTTSAERKLGDRIIRELYRDPDYIDDAVLNEYVQSLFLPLVQAVFCRGMDLRCRIERSAHRRSCAH